jgi:hypothetical protein
MRSGSLCMLQHVLGLTGGSFRLAHTWAGMKPPALHCGNAWHCIMAKGLIMHSCCAVPFALQCCAALWLSSMLSATPQCACSSSL